MKNNINMGIPIRFDYYLQCVETWRKIFDEINFKNIKSISEICSGWAPKICMALAFTEFDGCFTAVDSSEESLSIYKKLADTFFLKFNINFLKIDVLKDKIPPGDLVLANHAIEDLVLFYYLDYWRLKNKNPYGDVEQLKSIWKRIAKNFNVIKNPLVDILSELFTKAVKPNGSLLISQYPGYQEKLFGLSDSYEISLEICKKIGTKLKEKGFVEDKNVLQRAFKNIENPYFFQENCFCFKKP